MLTSFQVWTRRHNESQQVRYSSDTEIGGVETRLRKSERVGEVAKKRDLVRLDVSLAHPTSAPLFNLNESMALDSRGKPVKTLS